MKKNNVICFVDVRKFASLNLNIIGIGLQYYHNRMKILDKHVYRLERNIQK